MGEGEVIARSVALNTCDSIRNGLIAMGIKPGDNLLVHSSLSSLGWVCGGPVAVVQALLEVVTEQGTIVMPTHSGDYSDPALWENPPVPKEWWQKIRETMPAYDRHVAPTRQMGVIVECFRTFPGVIRSAHPTLSFAAFGKHAEFITADHQLENSLGEGSPLARLYDLKASVLLLGVGYDSNTSFHLAEYRSGTRPPFHTGSPIMEDGRRKWKRYRDIAFDSDIFDKIGADMEQKLDIVKKGQIGLAKCRLFNQPQAVDFATEWLRTEAQSGE